MDETAAEPMMTSSRTGDTWDDDTAPVMTADTSDNETEPARLTLCRAAHVYGIPSTKGWGRLVIAQEPNQQALKLTITEPDGKGGYRSANLRVDSDGYQALKTVFNGYGGDAMPSPETPSRAEKRDRQLKTLQVQNAKLRNALDAAAAELVGFPQAGEYPQAPSERVTLRGTRNYVNDDPAGVPTPNAVPGLVGTVDPRD